MKTLMQIDYSSCTSKHSDTWRPTRTLCPRIFPWCNRAGLLKISGVQDFLAGLNPAQIKLWLYLLQNFSHLLIFVINSIHRTVSMKWLCDWARVLLTVCLGLRLFCFTGFLLIIRGNRNPAIRSVGKNPKKKNTKEM